MTISMILPTWNNPACLKITLVCARSQTVRIDQIIVIDDDSDPEYATRNRELAIKYCAEYYYNHHTEKKSRRCEGYQIGMKYVTGDFVAFFCADHAFYKDTFEKYLKIFNQYENVAIFTAHFNLKPLTNVEDTLIKGQSLKEYIEERDKLYYGGFTGDESWWSTMDDIRLAVRGAALDGSVIVPTKYARAFDLWDIELWGHGDHCDDFANSCRKHGLSVITMKDIEIFNVSHERPLILTEGWERHKEILDEKWEGVLPRNPPLIVKGSLEKCPEPIKPYRIVRKLSVGCGSTPIQGFINIDIRLDIEVMAKAYPDTDVRFMDARKLEFSDESIDLIYAGNILEHLLLNDIESILQEWIRVLKPGGSLYISVPDAGLAIQKYVEDDNKWFENHRLDCSSYINGTIGWQLAHKLLYWSLHRMIFDRETLEWLLARQGLINLQPFASFNPDSSAKEESLRIVGVKGYKTVGYSKIWLYQ